MAQLAGLKKERMMFSKIESELKSYKIYSGFLNLSKEHNLELDSITSKKISIVKSLDTLSEGFPEHLQEFIVLHYKNGLTIKKTAERMGITTRTGYRYRLQVLCKLKVIFQFN